MVTVLVRLFEITGILWIIAEIVLQIRQFRQGEHAKTTEWGSLGIIVLSVAIGDILSEIVAAHLPALALNIPPVPLVCVSLPIMVGGIVFRLYSIHTLGKYFRGVVHVQEDHEVVRKGPYRVIRHPAYSGAMLAMTGIALTTNNIGSIVVFLACVFAGIYYRIRVEERVLSAGLGAAYNDYSTETKRLIPGVW